MRSGMTVVADILWSSQRERIQSALSELESASSGVFICKRMWDETRHVVKVPIHTLHPKLKTLLLAKAEKAAGKRRAATHGTGTSKFRTKASQSARKTNKSFRSQKINAALNVIVQRLYIRWWVPGLEKHKAGAVTAPACCAVLTRQFLSCHYAIWHEL